MKKLTMTVEQAADALGISRGLAYEAIRTDTLPHIRLGGRSLIPIAQFKRVLEGGAVEDHCLTEDRGKKPGSDN